MLAAVLDAAYVITLVGAIVFISMVGLSSDTTTRRAENGIVQASPVATPIYRK